MRTRLAAVPDGNGGVVHKLVPATAEPVRKGKKKRHVPDPIKANPDAAAQQLRQRMTDFMTNMHPPQPVPPSRLTLDEHTALTFLAEGARAMTWPIANACGLIAGGRCLPQARNMLRRLERWGLIARNKVMGHHTSWSITDAGRKAVQP